MVVVDKSIALFMAVQNAALEKERDANQLDDWTKESQRGGWSTHQVEPMRKKADQLRREAAELQRLIR